MRLRVELADGGAHVLGLTVDLSAGRPPAKCSLFLDGGLDGFVHAYLLAKAAGQVNDPYDKVKPQIVAYLRAQGKR